MGGSVARPACGVAVLTAESSQLLSRLTKLRRVVRRRLLYYGVCAVTSGGIAAFLTIVTLDWLLWLPVAIRLLGAVAFLAGFVAAVLHWIVRPWRATISLDGLARQLERHFGSLEDRLSSAVNFMEDRDAGSSELVDRVIDDTERLSRHYSFESALSRKPLYKQIARFMVASAILAVVMVFSRDWARIGLYRYLYPMGQIEWPRSVEIVPLTRNAIVAMGESVTVRMKIARGLTESLRGEVHLREPDGREWTLAMQRDADQSFYATIDAVTEDLRYWYVADDDSTLRDPFTIRVVTRPEVVELLATVEPPEYAAGRPPRVLDLSEGAIEAPEGGFVRIDVTASKPSARRTDRGGGVDAGLHLASGVVLPLKTDPHDPKKLTCRFQVVEDVVFRLSLRDKDGFENHGSGLHTIRAVPDAPPMVTWLEPLSLVEVPPSGSVKLSVRVADDFGVNALELHAHRFDGAAWPVVSLTEKIEMTMSPSGVVAVADYVWSLASLKAVPGDVVLYTGVAYDNHVVGGGTGQVGRSPPQRIRIISQAEFEVRLRSDLSQVESRIRRLVVAQAQVFDATKMLTSPEEEASNRHTERLNEASADQASLVRGVRELSRRVSALTNRINRNLSKEADMRARVERLGMGLTQVASRSMAEAANAMTTAAESRDLETQRPGLEQAMAAQQQAIDQLQSLLRSMSEWGQFQGLVAKTRALLERQDGLRGETSELGRRTLGKTTDSLTPDEAIGLKRVERMQRQLAEDIEHMLARMKVLKDRETETDAADADAVEQALRSAQAHDLSRRLHAATESISDNRLAAATLEQKGASQALRKVLKALQGRERRQLAELRKRMSELADVLAAIMEEERTLRAATHEATLLEPDVAAMTRLEQAQRRVRRNTQALAGEVGAELDHADIAHLVRVASGFMGDAETSLQEGLPAAGLENQDKSLIALQKAQDILDEQVNRVEEEIIRRTLSEVREQLEEIRESQAEINAGIQIVHEEKMTKGRLGRKQTREASRLARKQADVREDVNEVLPDFETVVVFRFAMERVATRMDAVRDNLVRRRIDVELVDRSQRIVHDLDRLIQAAMDTAELPIEQEFVNSGGGEGGASDQGKSRQKSVPTITELLVLKAMQVEINERTVALHRDMDPEAPTERQLRTLKVIGDDQSEVRHLTELVTKRARNH